MSNPSTNGDDPGVLALKAVAGLGRRPTDGGLKVHDILRAVVTGLGARAGALQVVDERTGRLMLAAAVNLRTGSDLLHNVAPLEGIGARVLEEGIEVSAGEGTPNALPEAFRVEGLTTSVGFPIRGRHRVMGVLWVAAGLPVDCTGLPGDAARIGAERLGWWLEESRLYQTLERAMGQILEADERMLGRIGLDIHDGPTQLLSVALLEVQLLEVDLNAAEGEGSTLPGGLRPALGRIYETLGGAVHEMRELIGQLRPAQFEGRELPDILGDAVSAFEQRTGARISYDVSGEFPELEVSISQRITLYRTLQEALSNAHRHGQASEVNVVLTGEPDGTVLEVTDNGRGFDVESVQRARAGAPDARFGIFGMRDRAELLGGSCEIVSERGVSTRIRVALPRWRPQSGSLLMA